MRALNQRMWLSLLVVGAVLFAASTSTAAADPSFSNPGACPVEAPTQPFLPWGDSASYVLAPDGDFEQGLAGWTVSGGADLVAGAEPWMVTDPAESQSLDLPVGSSATSPVTCVDADDPDLRFFAINQGDPTSQLAVSVSVPTPAGISVTLPVGVIGSDGAWAPSPQVWIGVNLLALDGSLPVQFTFTPTGTGDWRIDDLYVDPWGRT